MTITTDHLLGALFAVKTNINFTKIVTSKIAEKKWFSYIEPTYKRDKFHVFVENDIFLIIKTVHVANVISYFSWAITKRGYIRLTLSECNTCLVRL